MAERRADRRPGRAAAVPGPGRSAGHDHRDRGRGAAAGVANCDACEADGHLLDTSTDPLETFSHSLAERGWANTLLLEAGATLAVWKFPSTLLGATTEDVRYMDDAMIAWFGNGIPCPQIFVRSAGPTCCIMHWPRIARSFPLTTSGIDLLLTDLLRVEEHVVLAPSVEHCGSTARSTVERPHGRRTGMVVPGSTTDRVLALILRSRPGTAWRLRSIADGLDMRTVRERRTLESTLRHMVQAKHLRKVGPMTFEATAFDHTEARHAFLRNINAGADHNPGTDLSDSVLMMEHLGQKYFARAVTWPHGDRLNKTGNMLLDRWNDHTAHGVPEVGPRI
jgi:hypothetical protein